MSVEEVRGAIARRYAPVYSELIIKLKGERAERAPTPMPSPIRHLLEQGGLIVVGSPDVHGPFLARARDQHLAVKLALFLGGLGGSRMKVKLDTEITNDDLEENLISIGGPTVNMLTWRVNRELPIYFDVEKENQIVSRVSGRVYGEDVNGVVETVPNPFAEDKTLLVLAGKRIEGTRASVVAFTEKLPELSLGNIYDRGLMVKVVEGIDRDSDGLIDDVVILE